MTVPDSNVREKEIFEQAIDLAGPEARRAFVQEACRGDAALAQRVETLLRMHLEASEVFLPDEPVARDAADRVGAVIDRYKLLEKIGEGGFGVVYMAEQEQPVRRRVALKIIKLGMDTKEVVARFEAERQALALMDHPNIARVLDGGATDTGRPYFVMELVRGVPITTYCDQRKLPIRARLELFIRVCEAVQHAHQKGVIHRDLKPSNVLVTEIDDRPVPKVIDFGVARATAARLTERTLFTRFHQFIGTPAYMSPEQTGLGKLDIDTRSDVYALGVLLYELLTGQTPFDMKTVLAEGYEAILRTIREVEPPKPSTRLRTLTEEQLAELGGRRQEEPRRLGGSVQGDLDWIVMRCIEKDRTRRYETAASLAQDLERHLHNEPVTARPPRALYRLRKAVQRHRLAFAAAGLVLLALIGGLAVAAWSLGRERAARLHARRLLYAADMNLAQQSLKANNLARARVLLERNRPKQAADVDLRGWEWRYLWQETRSGALAELTRHSSVNSTSYSADGRHFAIGYYDGRVELWDAVTRTRSKVLVGSAGAAGCVAFAPRGNAVAVTAGPGIIEWHDLATGTSALRWRLASSVRDMAFSRDGARLVVTTTGAPELNLFDVATGEPTASREVATGHSFWFDGARLSPDGTRVYFSGLANGRPNVRCARVDDGSVIWEVDAGPREGVTAVELSPDGRWLATATGFEPDPIRVWDAATGALVATLAGHTKFVARLAFNADGAVLMSASSDQTVRLWSTATWTETALMRGHVEEVYAAAISPDGRFVVSGAEDGTVLFWDVTQQRATGGRVPLPSHVKSSWALPGGGAVLAMTSKGAFSVIDLRTQRETPLQRGPEGRTFFVPPNIFGEYDGREQVKLHEVTAHGTRAIGAVEVGEKFEGGFAYLPAKRLFAWGDGSRALHVIQVDRPASRIDLTTNVEPVRPLSFSPDGHIVRARWTTRTGMAWNLDTRQPIDPNVDDTGGIVSDVRTDEVGTSNRAGLPLEQFRRLRAPLRVDSPRFLKPADVGGLTSVALSSDGRLLAVGSETGFLALFNTANVADLTLLTANMQDVDGVAFSPDDRRLATTSHGDEMVKLWDVETRQELLTLAGVGSEIYAVEFTDDGNTILVGRAPNFGRNISGLCQFWTAPTWEEIAAAERSQTPAKAR